VAHARTTPLRVLDFSLVRIATFRANVVGGSLFRLGIGALAFLLPLLPATRLQLHAAAVRARDLHTALGAFTMKSFAAGFLRRFGFRNVLIYVGLAASALTAACATFTPSTPFAFMVAILLTAASSARCSSPPPTPLRTRMSMRAG